MSAPEAKRRGGRPAIAPGDVKPAGTVVARDARAFFVRKGCGHVVTVRSVGGLYNKTAASCRACSQRAVAQTPGRVAQLARARAARNVAALANAQRARYIVRALGDEPMPTGHLFREENLDTGEPEPCALRDLADLRRALGPDALAHCGTVRARYAGEAA